MRMHYLRKCEAEQSEAQESYNFIFIDEWNLLQSEISLNRDVSFRFAIMEMQIHDFMNKYTPLL